MPKRVFKLYQRKRVININVNVFVAGLLSIALAKYPVMLISEKIGHEHMLLISIAAYVIDTAIDIVLYFGLHWIANHWRPLKQSHLIDKVTTPESSRTRNFLVDVRRLCQAGFYSGQVFGVELDDQVAAATAVHTVPETASDDRRWIYFALVDRGANDLARNGEAEFYRDASDLIEAGGQEARNGSDLIARFGEQITKDLVIRFSLEVA